jgi:nucleotide-binding universal stress UspA family protein
MAGSAEDAGPLSAGASVAKAFDAELAAVFTPADMSELAPWIGDGFVGGGAPVAALDLLREVAAEGSRTARKQFEATAYATKSFIQLEAPIWAALGRESRLADLVVFGSPASGRGPSPLGDAFRQVLAHEQRPVLVADGPVAVGGLVAVAWDGGKEATRAARTALPLLQKSGEVVVLTAADAASRDVDPGRLVEFLCIRGVKARLEPVVGGHDVARQLLDTARGLGAELLVAGAFGHPRLQEFVFGGVTRGLLSATVRPALFLSH